MPIATLTRKYFSPRISPLERAWLVPAWLLLGCARALILLVSFRRLAPLLGSSTGNRSCIPLLTPSQRQRALQIGRTVRRAARYTPWVSNCFPQAVTARLLLGLYGIPYALFFGLARAADTKSGAMNAHAWIAADHIRVTGGEGFDIYTVVECFVAPQSVVATRAGAQR